MKKLNYGVIATGNIAGGKYLPGYAAFPERVNIMAACDVDEKALKSVAAQYNIPHTFTNYSDLLDMPELDFVSICLPNYLHAPVAIEAMRKGKHVHCEKPMALNAQQAAEMIQVSKETGKMLMIGLNNRFTAHAQFAKQYIEEGNLGEIYHVKCGWQRRACSGAFGWFTDKEKSGGGPLIDLGVHYIDLVLYMLGYPAPDAVTANIYAKLVNSDKGHLFTHDNSRMTDGKVFTVEDLAVGLINLKQDTSISFEISWASHIEKESIFYQFYGTKGGVRVSNEEGPMKVKIFTLVNDQHTDILPALNKKLLEVNEFAAFLDSIETGIENPVSIVSQNLEMMKIIDAIYASASTKRQFVFE